MKNQFDWQVGETEEEEPSLIREVQSWWQADAFWFLLGSLVIAGLLVGGWRVGQAQLARSERQLKSRIQTILDLERQAFMERDGDLFFSLQDEDPAWFAAQLLPENQALYRAGPEVTRAQSRDNYVWSNVSWRDGDQVWQRVLFFEWLGGQLVQVPTDESYWGTRNSARHSWGELVYQEVDAGFADSVASFVDGVVDAACTSGCLAGARPFRLLLAADYADTAAAGEVRLPSPRLLALTEAGKPAPLFWEQLRQLLEAHLLPVTIRFVVPPGIYPLLNYEQAAADFMAANPGIVVELVQLDAMPEDLAEVANEADGAAITPSVELIAAGLVHDLTDFALTDPDFAAGDFYEQIWQGARWHDRMWFLPQAAALPVIFYDREAYREAGLAEPSLRWTWEEMAQNVATLVSAQPEDSDLEWAFLDIGKDALFSYAYNWNNDCFEAPDISCRRPLGSEEVAAALDWYSQMAGRPGRMPDLTQLPSQYEREITMLSLQSSRRRAAVWVTQATTYEHYLLLDPIGVVPFPGSDRFDGITPLSVEGNFISQGSKHPLAVWQWLKYLSHQPYSASLRLVPARPSVAAAAGTWSILPRPLGEAMRTAFPFARPITLDELAYFSWEQLAAVIAGEMSPAEAAQQKPELAWFH